MIEWLLDRGDALFRRIFPCKHERIEARFRWIGEWADFYDECLDCGKELR